MPDKGFESKSSENSKQNLDSKQNDKKISRRQFIKLGVLVAGTGASIKGLSLLSEATKYKPKEIDLSSFDPPKDLGETEPLKEKLVEIESKYNINIFSVGQAREYVAKNFDPIQFYSSLGIDRWEETNQVFNIDQLNLLDNMLSNLPEGFYAPMYNRKFTLILRGNDFQNAGESYGATGMIGVGIGSINPENKEESFSLLVHEAMHRLGNRVTETDHLSAKVWSVLKDQNYLKLKEFEFEDRNEIPEQKTNPLIDGALRPEDKIGAIGTLKSFDLNRHSYSEGMSGIAQRYITGHERFMRAFGPLLDGNGYEVSSEELKNVDLERQFPKTQNLYDLYKTEIFEGKEYGYGSDN